jgi:hypothetical protein
VKDIENPMVIDRLWRHHEQEPKVIGECAGCWGDITANEHWYEFQEGKEVVLVHQESECCKQYVAEKSICCGQEVE